MKNKVIKVWKKIKDKCKKAFSFINKKNKFNTMEVIALLIIAVIFGMLVGGLLMYGKGALNMGIKKELNEFADTYTEILNEYYEDVSGKELLEAGINGMISYLGDPYSTYMDAEENEEFNKEISGKYVGVGIEIIQYADKKIEVHEAYEDGPAYEAGIRNSDILTKIDGKSIVDKNINEISELIQGKEGTSVQLTVLRDEEEKTFKVMRKEIDIISVNEEVIEYNNKKVGYMIIDVFAINTKDQFEKKLKKLEKEGIESLIIDVRNNSGGYLSSVTDILSLFLDKGDIIYQLKTKDKIEKITDKTTENRNYKIGVLVNGSSASASEVLTASLKENKDAIVVGTKTFGKSKVQKTQELSNGSAIKYTFQEWLTPKGESVGNKGIEPNYEVIYKDSDGTYDNQLTKALELITE